MTGPCTVTLTFENRTDKTFYSGTGGGLALSPANVTIAPGKTVTLKASGPIEVKGSLLLHLGSSSAKTCFQIDFDVLQPIASAGHRLPSLTIAAPAGYALGPQRSHVDFFAIDAVFTIYDGVALSSDSAVTVVDLTDDPMARAGAVPHLFADFVNAMFDPTLRSAASIGALVAAATKTITNTWKSSEAPPVFYADFTGGQLPAIVAMWATYWLKGGKGSCPPTDAVLIDQIKAFIGTATPPDLWIPRLSVHAEGPPAVLNLKGYDKIGFYKGSAGKDGKPQWSESTVTRFLTLLASGAHMVSICAADDLSAVGKDYDPAGDFYAGFAQATIERGNELGNSHYVGSPGLNVSGWYFLDIDGEDMPATIAAVPGGGSQDAGLLDAFMTSATVTDAGGALAPGLYNAFFQLEGWQQQGLTGGRRHMADYDSYKAVLWNIATFGASPYSEKRGTTVFLAPQGWTPEVTQVTCMMPYVGAYAVRSGPKDSDVAAQGWLNTDLVRIDTGSARKLNARYILDA